MAEPVAESSVRLLDGPAAVSAALSPLRRKLLSELAEPESAAGLARRLGLSRQRVNYHLRELESAGLVELVEERQRRGCVERRLRATADAFVVSPNLLDGAPSPAPAEADRFSSAHLVGLAARLIEEVAVQREAAAAAGERLLTLSLDTEVCFESPRAFKAFADEVAEAITEIAARHDVADGRRYRFVLGAHPANPEASP